MTEETSIVNDQLEHSIACAMPGELVRIKREEAGLSCAEVAASLHLTVHYIKALENDEYSKLPAQTFVKGYFRSYARLLKMDEQEVLDNYEFHMKQLNQENAQAALSQRIRKRTDQVIIWAVVAAIVLVIALVSGWWFFGRETSRSDMSSSQPVSNLRANSAMASPQVSFNSRADQQTETDATSVDLENAVDIKSADESVADESSADESSAMSTADAAVSEVSGSNEVADQALLAETAPVNAEDSNEVIEAAIEESIDASIEASNEASIAETTDKSLGQATNQAATIIPSTNTATAADPALEQSVSDTSLLAAASAIEPEDSFPVAANTSVASSDSQASQQIQEQAPAVAAAPLQQPEVPSIDYSDDGSRFVELQGEGNDLLSLAFSGTSWVEVGATAEQTLYTDLMSPGDKLQIKSEAPFYILLGDATQVDVSLNNEKQNIRYRIRLDKSARFIVADDGVKRWVLE